MAKKTYTEHEAINAAAKFWRCDPDDLVIINEDQDDKGNVISRAVLNIETGRHSDEFMPGGFKATDGRNIGGERR